MNVRDLFFLIDVSPENVWEVAMEAMQALIAVQ
jgi:hypothetical protein